VTRALILTALMLAGGLAPAGDPARHGKGCKCDRSACECGPFCYCYSVASGHKKADDCPRKDCRPAEAADPSKSVAWIKAGDSRGSGTVVACEGGESLVVTNRHVCPTIGEGVTVQVGFVKYPGKVVSVSQTADLAAVVVAADLPACEVADAVPAPGTAVVQYGCEAGGPPTRKAGKAGAEAPQFADRGDLWHVESTGAPGDSGCGVFAGGRLAGVYWGVIHDPDRHSCVHLANVRLFLRCVGQVKFPKLAAKMAAREVARPKAADPVQARPQQPQPSCPDGRCPVQSPPVRVIQGGT
jgi:hypothetical protein